MTGARPFLVLVGGPAGAGKSRLAQALAGTLGSTVGQVDDVQTAIEALVPPERLPEYYVPSTTYLRTDFVAEIADAIEVLADWFAPAVRGVIASRFESGTPTVLEGDFISPQLAAEVRSAGVRSVFLLATASEIRESFRARDGDDQAGRAEVSAERSRRLEVRCQELGVPAIRARPFGTLLPRASAAIGLVSG